MEEFSQTTRTFHVIDRSLFTLPKVGMVMGILLVLALAEAACVLGEAYALARAITNLWEGGVLADQAVLVAVFAACFIGKQVLVYGRDTFLARFSRQRASELRDELLKRVFSAQGGVVAEHGSAAVTQAALDGIEQAETYLGLILPKIIGVVAIPLPILIAVFIYDWVSGIILLVFFPVIIFFMIVLGRQASARAAAQYESYNALSNHFIDTLRGIDTLKVFGRAKSFGARIFQSSEDFRYATVETLKTATLSGAVLDLVATLGVAGVSLMLGFRLIDGIMTLFPALATLVLSPEYFKPIREFAGDFHASLDGKNALKSITAIIANDAKEIAPVDVEPWDESSKLRLDNIAYSYPVLESDKPAAGEDGGATLSRRALEDVSFRVQGYTKVGIVGLSGSGKSTLANLIGGFARPDEGTIGVAGTRTASLQQPSWQRQLLYIPQNPYLFHASLRDNIRFYSPDADDEAMAEAISVTGLDDLVKQLPDGLDTVIGEGGRGLSGGQAQRIALARALLDPSRKVLIFDEPTAHLDIETELELKERMLPLMEGKLVFFATHRLHWLANMDYILVLEDGRVAEQGTLDDLLARNGKLVELVATMNRGDVA